MKIAELFAEITLKGGKTAISDLKGIMSSTIAVKAALIGATTALYKMSEVARQSAVFMDMYSVNTGLSSEQLQKLSFQASQAGVSMQELGGAIQKLQQANANARLGYGWDPVLTRFGLHPGQDPVTQLNKIGEAIRRLHTTNPAEAKALASRAGISDSMYYAMMRGTTEQMNKQLILTDKEKSALVKLNQQWNKFWFYIKQITIKIQALGAGFQSKFVRVLTRAVQGFYELYRRIVDVITASDKLKYLVIALGVALAYAFTPELLILGGIAVLLEDIFTYFEGGDSITGEIAEWCKQSEEFMVIWEGIKTVFELVWEAVKLSIEGWRTLFEVLNDAGVFKAILDGISEVFAKIVQTIIGLTQNPVVQWALKRAGIDEKVNDIANRYIANTEGIDYSALATPASSVTNGGNNYNNDTKITAYFQSSGDAGQDGRTLGEFQRGVQQAAGQSNSLSLGSKNGGLRYGYSGGGRGR